MFQVEKFTKAAFGLIYMQFLDGFLERCENKLCQMKYPKNNYCKSFKEIILILNLKQFITSISVMCGFHKSEH